MSDPNSTPTRDSGPRVDPEHQRGETGARGENTASAAPRNPVAHAVPGAVPGNPGIDNTAARMVPAGNAAGGTGPNGRSSEGTSGGAGLPGGTGPADDDRREKRV